MVNTQNDESPRMTLWQTICAGSGTAADRRNQLWFVAWTFAWAATFVVASWVLKNHREAVGVGGWALALLPNIFAIGAMLAYLKFLRNADELLRRIQLEGLAIGFGTGIIFAIGYQLLERAGAPALAVDDFMLVLCGGWVAGQLAATWRYR